MTFSFRMALVATMVGLGVTPAAFADFIFTGEPFWVQTPTVMNGSGTLVSTITFGDLPNGITTAGNLIYTPVAGDLNHRISISFLIARPFTGLFSQSDLTGTGIVVDEVLPPGADLTFFGRTYVSDTPGGLPIPDSDSEVDHSIPASQTPQTGSSTLNNTGKQFLDPKSPQYLNQKFDEEITIEAAQAFLFGPFFLAFRPDNSLDSTLSAGSPTQTGVPEPSSILLLASALAVFGHRRRRRSSSKKQH